MNRPIRNLSVACMVLFVALLINATFVQYWQSDSLSSLSAHPDNKRVRDAEFARERGAILVRGKAVAESNKTHDSYKYQRTYPNGLEYAHLTGFFSRDWGLGGIESSQNSILSGSDSALFVNRVIDLVDNQAPQGGSVSLTINPKAQQAAYDKMKALGPDRAGRRRGPRAQHRQDPRDGLQPGVRPQPAGQPRLRPGGEDQGAAGEQQAAAAGQPRHRGDPAAGVDLQAGHGGGGAGLRALHPGDQGPRRRQPRPAPDDARTSSTRTAAAAVATRSPSPRPSRSPATSPSVRSGSTSVTTRSGRPPRSSAGARAPSTTSTTR